MSDEDKDIPSFITNSIDFKKILVFGIFNLIQRIKDGKVEDVSMGKNTSVSVMTNFGLVSGRVMLFDNESEKEIIDTRDFGSLFYLETVKSVDKVMANLEDKIGPETIKVINQTGRLMLADVTITPFANPQNKYKLARLLLFTDQIVGITFGEESYE